MSEWVNEPRVNQYVYHVHRAQRPGRIIEILGKTPGGHFDKVKVLWADRTVEERSTNCLNDFMSLIQDQKKKLDTHYDNLYKITSIG